MNSYISTIKNPFLREQTRYFALSLAISNQKRPADRHHFLDSFRYIGVVVISVKEMATILKTFIYFIWFNWSLSEKAIVGGLLVRRLIASVIGTVVAYNLTLKLFEGEVVTAMIGLTICGQIALGVVCKDIHQPFNL